MTAKRSDRLRSMIAATVTDAAENAAPVTVTGAGLSESGNPQESRLKTAPIPSAPAHEENRAAEAAPALPEHLAPLASPTVVAPQKISVVERSLRAPERPVRSPKWEKANVTLEPRDLAILQHSDSQARQYGFRIRKGGNPSLFVRAGLRLLDELGDRDPEEWIKRIAATTSPGPEQAE